MEYLHLSRQFRCQNHTHSFYGVTLLVKILLIQIDLYPQMYAYKNYSKDKYDDRMERVFIAV